MFRNQSTQKTYKLNVPSHQAIPPYHNSYNANYNHNSNQSSQLLIRPSQTDHHHVPLQKTRTFSHKKLTLTSAMPSPMAVMNMNMNTNSNINTNSNQCTNNGRRTYGFESSKFYRPPQPHNKNIVPIVHCKKISNNNMVGDECKVSLKLSVAVSQMSSPQKPRDNNNNNSYSHNNSYNNNNNNNNNNSESLIAGVELQQLKHQLKQCLTQKTQNLHQQIIRQCQQIRSLEDKINTLELQLQQKTSIIASLTFKCNSNQQKQQQISNNSNNSFNHTFSNTYSSLNHRLTDLQKVLAIISKQSHAVQQKINNKLDRLTRELVQMNINKTNINKTTNIHKQPNWYNNLEQSINKIKSKMEKQLSQKQMKLTNVQVRLTGFQGRWSKLNDIVQEIIGNYRLIDYKVARMESDLTHIRVQKQRLKQKQKQKQKQIWKQKHENSQVMNQNQNQNNPKINTQHSTDTKDSISCWQTFQDYVLTNRSDNQLKNISIFAHDDYFFHPDARTNHNNKSNSNNNNNNNNNNGKKDVHCSIASIPSTYSSVLPHFIYHASQMASVSSSIANLVIVNNHNENNHKDNDNDKDNDSQDNGTQSPQYYNYGNKLTSFSDITTPVVNCLSPTQAIRSQNNNTNNNINNTNTNSNSSSCADYKIPVNSTLPSTSTSTSTSTSSTPPSSLQTVLSVMHQLKQHYHEQLPIRCKLDRHGRILMTKTNRLLQDTATQAYLKITAEEGKILVNRGYLDIAVI